TLYLAKALEDNNSTKNSCNSNQYAKSNIDSENLLPMHLINHNYDRKTNKISNIDQQYAYDIGYIGTSKYNIENKEKQVTKSLKKRNLIINKTKTEKFTVSKNSDDEWKK